MSATKIQIRRDSQTNWEYVNPTLAAGEFGLNTTNGKFKLGDGSNDWISLPYSTILPSELTELAQDAVASALTAGDGIDVNYNDAGNTLTVSNTGVLSFNTRTGSISLTDTDVNTALGYTAADAADLISLGSSTNTDISNAIITAEGYTDAAIAQEVTDRNSAISTAKGQAISTAETYADGLISTEVTNRNSAIATAKSQAISTAEGYTDTAITNLVNGAPATLDTLKEIADALGSDANLSTTLTNSIATKAPIASPTFTGTVTLPAGTVTSGMILDDTIVNADINASAAIAATKIAGTAVTQADTGTVTSAMIADGTIVAGDIADGAITSAKILDGTIVNADVNASAAIAYSKLNLASSITSSDIVDDTIVNADINASAAIAATKIAGTAVTQADTGTVTSTMIADGTIVNADINASAAIAATKIAGTAVTQADTGTVTSAMIADGTIVAGDIADGAITSAKILDGTILNADINASADIATSKISGLDTALSAKAPLASPTFTGTVSGITKSMVGLGNVDNTADTAKPVSTATQTALDLKLASATAATTYETIANVALKAPLASPTFTGTVTLPTGTVTSGMILDGTIVDADINASAAIAQSKISGLSTSLGLKADLASPTFTGTPLAPTASDADNSTKIATTAYADRAAANAAAALVNGAPSTLDTLKELADAINDDSSFAATVTTALGTKLSTATAATTYAPLASPTFTGSVTLPLTTGGYVTTTSGGVISSVATIPNGGLTNSGFTINGTGISLGETKTITAAAGTLTGSILASGVTSSSLTSVGTLANLTVTNTITGSVSGNAATVTNGVYTTDTGTVTNTMLAGSIANSKLTNSTITINGTAISLGGSVSGLATLDSPTFTGTVTIPSGSVITGVPYLATANTFTGGVQQITTASAATKGLIVQGAASQSADLQQWQNSTGTVLAKVNSSGQISTETASASYFTSPNNAGAYIDMSSNQVVTIFQRNPSNIGLMVRGAASQVASLQQWQNSAGTVIAGVDKDGNITASSFVGNASTATALATARNINGVAFDGSAAITITAANPNALTIGTGLSGTSYTGSGAVTIAIDSTVATLTGTQTLTNKTLSSAVATGGITHNGSTSGTIVLQASAVAGLNTLTLPAATDTLVGKATTDTLTNKTLDTAGTGNVLKINGTQVSAVTGTGSVVLAASPTLTGTVSAAAVSTSGDVTVGGNLTVNGTTTTLNTATLTVTDANIEIAKVASPTDVTANGAGITIKGATDKTFNWYSSTSALTSSENMDLASGKVYKIAGTQVLSASQYVGNAATVTNGVYTTDTATVTNTMLAGSIADSKLNTISTSGKVSNSATTATSANTASAIVARDSSGNFTAGTITAALSGNASTATTLATPRAINGVNFDGSAAITVTAAAGTLTGSILNSGVTTSSLTSVGTITSGTWNGTTIAIANGGTGQTTAAAAANALLPSQTSNSGKYLTTDGAGNLSWGTVSGYSAPTIGSTSIGSGATVTTIAGLTLTTPTINGATLSGTLSGNHTISGVATFSSAPVISSITNTGTLTLPTTTGTLALTSGVINNTLTTTTGDMIYASSANTPARLGIGSTNQILTVVGGVPTWAAAPSSAPGAGTVTFAMLANETKIMHIMQAY